MERTPQGRNAGITETPCPYQWRCLPGVEFGGLRPGLQLATDSAQTAPSDLQSRREATRVTSPPSVP